MIGIRLGGGVVGGGGGCGSCRSFDVSAGVVLGDDVVVVAVAVAVVVVLDVELVSFC